VLSSATWHKKVFSSLSLQITVSLAESEKKETVSSLEGAITGIAMGFTCNK
jgi:hypothetical protein